MKSTEWLEWRTGTVRAGLSRTGLGRRSHFQGQPRESLHKAYHVGVWVKSVVLEPKRQVLSPCSSCDLVSGGNHTIDDPPFCVSVGFP